MSNKIEELSNSLLQAAFYTIDRVVQARKNGCPELANELTRAAIALFVDSNNVRLVL